MAYSHKAMVHLYQAFLIKPKYRTTVYAAIFTNLINALQISAYLLHLTENSLLPNIINTLSVSNSVGAHTISIQLHYLLHYSICPFGYTHIAYHIFIHPHKLLKTHQSLFPDIPLPLSTNHHPRHICIKCDLLEVYTNH